MKQNRYNSTSAAPMADQTILAEDEFYAFNDYKSGLNDNILVVGGSGTGKTRSIVSPNILQATGSYIICDPKGNLYDHYRDFLVRHGYHVDRLDFIHPEKSTVKYNLFHYIHTQTDILKVANMFCGDLSNAKDPFWDRSSNILYECLISYLIEAKEPEERNLVTLIRLLQKASRSNDNESEMDRLLKKHGLKYPDSMADRAYRSVAMNPHNTWNCIISNALSKFASYDTKELRDMLNEDTLRLDLIGTRKQALFIVVSDTDRSMDELVNVFYTQAMQELCRVADAREDSRLPVPVRFILDDFATNCRIDEFPRMISSIRSRAISTMLIVQAEAQLRSGYDDDAETIISNCDTYVYLGGNDIKTARAVGERCDRPMMEILNMPVGTCWVFRRGQVAHQSRTFQLEAFEEARRKEAESLEPVLEAEPATEASRDDQRASSSGRFCLYDDNNRFAKSGLSA